MSGLCQEVGWSSGGGPFWANVEVDFCASCAYCEIWFLVNADTHKLRDSLVYDERKGTTSSKGLALAQDVPELQLVAGDRVGPTPSTPDVASVLSNSHVEAVTRGARPPPQHHLRSEARHCARFTRCSWERRKTLAAMRYGRCCSRVCGEIRAR